MGVGSNRVDRALRRCDLRQVHGEERAQRRRGLCLFAQAFVVILLTRAGELTADLLDEPQPADVLQEANRAADAQLVGEVGGARLLCHARGRELRA